MRTDVTGQDPIAAALGAIVEAEQLAGAATLVWRDGVVAHHAAIGRRDLETGAPVERDTIFRIASMTKPITSVAALMLMEEGRLALDEPITRWAPEFADMRVLRAVNGPLDDTVPAEREITFRDLLTHRAGLTYGDFHSGPIAGAYAAALGADIDSHLTPDEWITGLASLPLLDQPGGKFCYGHATDLLGFLIARVDGAPLGQVLRRRIFEPLGMKDTGFLVPKDQRGRRAGVCGYDAAGKPSERLAPGAAFLPERPEDMTYEAGSGGLWSTVDDYLAFARLFVSDGEVDGARLLKPQTVALMRTNQLTPDQRANSSLLGTRPFASGHGFGLGVAVVMDPDKAAIHNGKGGVGTVCWPGAYGGWWQADPTNGTIMIFLTHNMFDFEQLMQGIGLGAFAAVEQFHALASAM